MTNMNELMKNGNGVVLQWVNEKLKLSLEKRFPNNPKYKITFGKTNQNSFIKTKKDKNVNNDINDIINTTKKAIRQMKEKKYTYTDMRECWIAGRKNLVEWGVGDGDKPDFSSWIKEKFAENANDLTTPKQYPTIPELIAENQVVLDEYNENQAS